MHTFLFVLLTQTLRRTTYLQTRKKHAFNSYETPHQLRLFGSQAKGNSWEVQTIKIVNQICFHSHQTQGSPPTHHSDTEYLHRLHSTPRPRKAASRKRSASLRHRSNENSQNQPRRKSAGIRSFYSPRASGALADRPRCGTSTSIRGRRSSRNA